MLEKETLLCRPFSFENIFNVESWDVVKMESPLRVTATPVTASLCILWQDCKTSLFMLLQAIFLLSSVRSSNDSMQGETGESSLLLRLGVVDRL